LDAGQQRALGVVELLAVEGCQLTNTGSFLRKSLIHLSVPGAAQSTFHHFSAELE
jgi:hypothetical protein